MASEIVEAAVDVTAKQVAEMPERAIPAVNDIAIRTSSLSIVI